MPFLVLSTTPKYLDFLRKTISRDSECFQNCKYREVYTVSAVFLEEKGQRSCKGADVAGVCCRHPEHEKSPKSWSNCVPVILGVLAGLELLA